MISDAVYKRLCSEAEDYQLGVLSDRKFQLADGTPLATQGKLKVDIQLGPVAVTHDVIVGSIYDEGIIGYDFLKTHGCVLDINNDELQVKGKRVSRCASTENCEENIANLRSVELRTTDFADAVGNAIQYQDRILKIKETIQVDSESEQLVEVILSQVMKEMSAPLLVEPLAKFEQRYNIKVAAALINPQAEQVFVRILNPHNEKIQLHKNCEVANVDTIENCYFLDDEDEETYDKEMTIRRIGSPTSTSLGPSDEINEDEEKSVTTEDLPEHLRELYAQSTCDMNGREAQLVLRLLIEFQTVFAKDKNDIGKLHPMYGEHEIPTGDAAPVRQRPYRVPAAFREVEEKEIERMLEMGV